MDGLSCDETTISNCTTSCDCLNCLGKSALKDLDLFIKKLNSIHGICCDCKKQTDQLSSQQNIKSGRSKIPLAINRFRIQSSSKNLSRGAPNSQLPSFTKKPLAASQSFVESTSEENCINKKNLEKSNLNSSSMNQIDRNCFSENEVRTQKMAYMRDVSNSKIQKFCSSKAIPGKVSFNLVKKEKPKTEISNDIDVSSNASFNLHNWLHEVRNKRSTTLAKPSQTNFNPIKKIEINLTCKDAPTDIIISDHPVMTSFAKTSTEKIISSEISNPDTIKEDKRYLEARINQINLLRREAQKKLNVKLDTFNNENRCYRSW